MTARRTFAVAMLCAFYVGALAGRIGFDMFERSYFNRGRIYVLWMTRSAAREHPRGLRR